MRLYQAETFAKYTGVTQYDQPFHVPTTPTTPALLPCADGRWRRAQMFLYLSDATLAHGATRIVSRELTRDTPQMALSFQKARVPAERLAEWEASATSAVGPRGSLLVYGADVVHRGDGDDAAGRRARFFFNLAYRAAGADWVGANPWPRKGTEHWTPLVESLSPRQLEALGFPPPGHDYWDETTLQGAADRYPKLDLIALARGAGRRGTVPGATPALLLRDRSPSRARMASAAASWSDGPRLGTSSVARRGRGSLRFARS